MPKKISLNGIWKLRWFDGERGVRTDIHLANAESLSRAYDVSVPGEVHQQLQKLGLIDDPNVGLNVLKARWVEESFWIYSRTFKAAPLVNGERSWLVFEGLDLAAVIFLNGKEVGRHANYYYPCRIDVTDHLKPGVNTLDVSVESGVFHAMNRSSDGLAGNIGGHLTKRHWLRKPQCSHGWDWSPRLLNVGIHGSVWIETARAVRFDSMTAFTETDANRESGRAVVRVYAEGLGTKPVEGVLIISATETGQLQRIGVTINPGMNRFDATIVFDKPNLWWPVGHGDQPLYTITAELRVDAKKIGAAHRRVGFRLVRVNQDVHPDHGTFFIIEVNGKPVFCKGGNLVPADMVVAAVDRSRYQVLIDRALESNFNFLRVWGGGIYEHDDFYELCDEKGIMVWQEFIFACAKYPANNEQFLADVKKEATFQIRRLASHASLLIWCGNNEMEVGAWDWGYDKGVAHPDYALFHLELPRLLQTEDPSRYYQPSSPMSPGGKPPNQDDTGDQHPWSIGFTDTDFRKYRDMICRFPNEGGCLGPTSLPTVKACLPDGMDHFGSLAWEIHDNSINTIFGVYPTDAMMTLWTGRSMDELTLDEYVYWGGVVQGAALSEYIRNFRRRMFDSAAAIFWMFNDCWPAVRSWTTVDYYMRRTPSFWPVKRAFAPVIVVVVREKNRVKIFGVNEGESIAAQLRFGLFSLKGSYPVDKTVAVELPSNRSTLLAEFDGKLWDRAGVNNHCAFAILSSENSEIARDRLILPLFKEMNFVKSQISINIKDKKAIFKSAQFVFNVCIDLDGEKKLADNFFDIYPGVPTVIDWPYKQAPRILFTGKQVTR